MAQPPMTADQASRIYKQGDMTKDQYENIMRMQQQTATYAPPANAAVPPIENLPEVMNVNLAPPPTQDVGEPIFNTPQVAPQVNYQDVLSQMAGPTLMAQESYNELDKLAAAKGKELASFYKTVREEDQKSLNAMKAATEERKADFDKKFSEIDAETSALANQKVDPNQFWANRSTGDKILAGIGLFLGAAGSGGNKASAVINDAINRDIAAQKANISQRTETVGMKRGLLRDAYARFQDLTTAETATRVAYLKNAMLQADEIAARYSGPEQKAKIGLLKSELAQNLQNQQLKLVEQLQKMSPMPLNPNANPETLTEDQKARLIPSYGFANTKEDASKMKEYLGEFNAASSGVKKLLAIADRQYSSISPADRAEAQTIAQLLQGSLRTQILGQGAVSDSERALLTKIIADPTAIFSLDESNKKKLNTLLQTLNSNRDARLEAYGIKTEKSKFGAGAPVR